jgi:thiol-disulfide isomerase/thioredoxin
MKKHFFLAAIIVLPLTIPFTINAQATNDAVTEDSVAVMKRLHNAIEANPNDLEAHEAYLKTSGFTKWGAPENKEFIAQYEAWMKKFPRSAVVAYALGHAFAGKESPKAKPYLLKAIEIDPKFDKAYRDLWIDAERWGDSKAGTDYLLKAKNVNPQNADYAFYYASSFSDSDHEKYKRLSLQVAKDFPNTERGAQALYWLGFRSKDVQEQIKYFELLRTSFPSDKFSWSSSGMTGYYDVLLEAAPPKAVALAQEMAKGKGAKEWTPKIAVAQAIAEARNLLSQKKAAEAVTLLGPASVGRWSSANVMLTLLKAEAADAAGNTAAAYDSLVVFFAKAPRVRMQKELERYGAKLGKTKTQIEEDVWKLRDAASKPATPFTLQRYMTPGTASLSDFKGKVVLLTYWFPGCGPCRGEFPHFENVVKKFKGKDFEYLGINIVLEQDEYVVPFMKASRNSFTPLRDDPKWDKGTLAARGAPTNYLIDQEGRIVFANFRTNEHNEDELELMIDSMLRRNNKKNELAAITK